MWWVGSGGWMKLSSYGKIGRAVLARTPSSRSLEAPTLTWNINKLTLTDLVNHGFVKIRKLVIAKLNRIRWMRF
jgi:hypothetical protein